VRGIFGPDQHRFDAGPLAATRITLGPVSVGALDLIAVVIAIALMLALNVLLQRTPLGRSIRAVADDRTAAAILGVNLERTIALTFFLAAALGAAAGILIGLQYGTVSLDMGSRIELKGLAIIVLGGMGSITGAVIAAFILGIAETLSVALISSSYRDAIAFALMFLILVARPSGLFGKTSLRGA
jgi:branched-chain amino acid transport system permease protein